MEIQRFRVGRNAQLGKSCRLSNENFLSELDTLCSSLFIADSAVTGQALVSACCLGITVWPGIYTTLPCLGFLLSQTGRWHLSHVASES